MRAKTGFPRRVQRLAPLLVAAFACQEVKLPLGDAPSRSSGGAGAGGTAGSEGGTVGGTGGDTGASAGAGGTHGGTNAAGEGGSVTTGAGGGPAGAGGGTGRGGSGNDPGGGGEPGDADVDFVVIDPMDPVSATLRAGVTYYINWFGAGASGEVLAGFSTAADPAADYPVGVRFLWTAETGPVRLPYSSPEDGYYDPEQLSKDGKTVFGGVMKVQRYPDSTVFGPVSFYRYSEETGDVPFGPDEPMWNGQIDFVSPDGKAAVGTVELTKDVESGGGSRAFRWTESRGFELLSTLGWPERAGYSAVSEDLSVIAGYGEDGHGFLWFEPDVVIPLTDFATFPYCSANSISRDGSVAFGTCNNEAPAESTSLRWTAQTGMVVLDVPNVRATADGQLAVGTDGQALYRWNATSGVARLEPPTQWAAGGTHPMTLERDSLSMDGSAVWGRIRPDLGGGIFRWSEAGGFALLEPLPGHDTSWVMGQTADGSVQAGLSKQSASMAIAAVLWDCEGVRDIATELLDAGADLHGVSLDWATHVWSEASLRVAGIGSMGGNGVAWIARLPKRC